MSPLGRRRRRRPSEAVADNAPIPAGPVDDEEAAALRAAIELRAAQPAADLPTAEFVEGLRRRLGELEGEGPPPRVGRRTFLTVAGAGAGAVAAGVAGAVVGRTLLSRGAATATPSRCCCPSRRSARRERVTPARISWVEDLESGLCPERPRKVDSCPSRSRAPPVWRRWLSARWPLSG